MKKILFFVLCLYSFVAKAQNLVPNVSNTGVIRDWRTILTNQFDSTVNCINFLGTDAAGNIVSKRMPFGSTISGFNPNSAQAGYYTPNTSASSPIMPNDATAYQMGDGNYRADIQLPTAVGRTGILTITRSSSFAFTVKLAGTNMLQNTSLGAGQTLAFRANNGVWEWTNDPYEKGMHNNNNSGANHNVEISGTNITAVGNLTASQLNAAGLFFHSAAVAGVGQVATITAGGKTTGNFASKIAFQTTAIGGNQPTETVSISSFTNATTLQVNGSFGANIRDFTATTTMTNTDNTVIYTGIVTGVSVNLPTASLSNKRIYRIVNKSLFPLTFSISYQNMNNAAVLTMPANTSIVIQSNGTVWHQVGN